MAARSISWLSLPVVTALLAVLTVALIAVGRLVGLGTTTFFLLIVPLALAFAYLAWYRTLPYEPSRPAPALEDDAGEEPFVDPVEEADRLGEGSGTTDEVEDPLDA